MEEEKKEVVVQQKEDNNQTVVENAKEENQTAVTAVEKENTNVAIVEKEPPAELEDLQSQYLRKQIEKGTNVTEIANDFAKSRVTNEIINNESKEGTKFRKELAEEQKETLRESFKQDKVRQQTGTLTEKQKKAEAFYISVRPVLEFDFSPLIHKKYEKDEETKKVKNYEDRSYGIPLMCLMLALFVIPYCVFSFILALFNGINAILEAIATFGKVARTIATTIFILVILTLVVYCLLLGIDLLFGTSIISNIGILG